MLYGKLAADGVPPGEFNTINKGNKGLGGFREILVFLPGQTEIDVQGTGRGPGGEFRAAAGDLFNKRTDSHTFGDQASLVSVRRVMYDKKSKEPTRAMI